MIWVSLLVRDFGFFGLNMGYNLEFWVFSFFEEFGRRVDVLIFCLVRFRIRFIRLILRRLFKVSVVYEGVNIWYFSLIE